MKLAFFDASKGGFKDKLVAWWTAAGGDSYRSPFSHVTLLLDEEICSSTPCFTSSPDKGVKAEMIDLTNGDWYVMDIPMIPRIDEHVEKFLWGQLGKEYDWMGILGFALNAPDVFQEKKKWFCSELIVRALQISGHLCEVKPARTTPNLLFFYLAFEYDGVIYHPPSTEPIPAGSFAK